LTALLKPLESSGGTKGVLAACREIIHHNLSISFVLAVRICKINLTRVMHVKATVVAVNLFLERVFLIDADNADMYHVYP
jgi:hypothetical protein